MKPIYGRVWLLFDLENGNPRSVRYCWCFETRRLAREYRKHVHSMRKNVRLSPPIKYVQLKEKHELLQMVK